MIDQNDIQTFKAAIDAAKTVFITAHVGPDGDTLGSMLGLMHTFKAYFPNIKTVHCVIAGKMPDAYRFMPGIEEVKDVETATDLLDQYDLSFSVDCGSADRLGPAKTYFLNAKQSINIDHHVSNSRFGQVNIIDVNASASGEVIADLLDGNGIAITPEAAACLYVAILTDTGGFKYSNTTAKILELAATFTRQGANPENIYRHIYEEIPKVQAMLQAEAVQNARFNEDESLSWTVVTREMMQRHQASDENVEGLVEALRRIDTVKVSAMLKETKHGETKVSLRSYVPYINVSDVAARWNGGGHKMAAGCTINLPPAQAEQERIPGLAALVKTARPVAANA